MEKTCVDITLIAERTSVMRTVVDLDADMLKKLRNEAHRQASCN
jgi:hypothetical protein